MNSEHIKEDIWLSKIIEKPAFVVYPSEDFFELLKNENSQESKWLEFIKSNGSFAFCKVEPIETRIIEGIEKIGFNLIDTNVSLENKYPSTEFNSNYNFSFAKKEDKDGTMDVASNSFVYSRFHLDHRISNQIADLVKKLWVGNYFSGERGTHMILAKDGEKTIGFLQLILKNNSYIIDLIAVSKDYRKQGIAKNLIQFANLNLPNIASVIVGTQIANIPSINLYEKLGFRFKAAKYVFHYNKN